MRLRSVQYASFYRGCNVLPELRALVLGRQQHRQVHHFLIKLLPQTGQSRRMNHSQHRTAQSLKGQLAAQDLAKQCLKIVDGFESLRSKFFVAHGLPF